MRARRGINPGLLLAGVLTAILAVGNRATGSNAATSATPAVIKRFVDQHCVTCHNTNLKTSGLALDEIGNQPVSRHPEIWERVVRKLTGRQMPPIGSRRPDERSYTTVLALLETSLDRAAAARPNPGRTSALRRLNQIEYQNAIRDLLSMEIDAATLLPSDPASREFDNMAGGDLPPALLERYVTAAQKVSRLAVGTPVKSPGGDTYRVPGDRTQEEHVDGLPLGTRGGILIPYIFPQGGEYEVAVRLTRDRNEEVEGLHEAHELVLLLDRARVGSFTVTPPKDDNHAEVDKHLKRRLAVTAGAHRLGVTFVKMPSALLETKRQPYHAHFNLHRHPRQAPAVFQVSITGPYSVHAADESPSRRRIFSNRPKQPADEEDCAVRILSPLMRRAYRRPITRDDLQTPLRLFRRGSAEGGFEAGIESALSAVLVSPFFLMRADQEPPDKPPGTAYRIGDLELASRLSFFLWSSIPDEELLGLAERGRLSQPQVMTAQVRRMLADPRARALVTNFAAQWLYLRNLDSMTRDLRLFPDFDDNLKQAFRRETELCFESLLRENRSVLDLLKADFTYLDERLAQHYGIPYVYGSRFRRVALDPRTRRGGILRHGSILSTTAYATRTSPVIRGKWVLENLLGMPPPPPLPNVPALEDNTVAAHLPVRERLSQHRANPACVSCHQVIDPVGFALENYDAVGRWRDVEAEKPIDATGGLPDGGRFEGVAGLEHALLQRPELFVRTMAEKLLSFALGRAVEECDGPAIRKILRRARVDGYKFSSLIIGIADSVPFRMRRKE